MPSTATPMTAPTSRLVLVAEAAIPDRSGGTADSAAEVIGTTVLPTPAEHTSATIGGPAGCGTVDGAVSAGCAGLMSANMSRPSAGSQRQRARSSGAGARRPHVARDRASGKVQDPGTHAVERVPGQPVVMPAQQQLG